MEFEQVLQGQVGLTSLDPANVRTVDIATFGECLLSRPAGFSRRSHHAADVLHGVPLFLVRGKLGRFFFQHDGTNSFFGFEYFSGIYDWSLKYDFDYIPSPQHYLKFGVGATYHTFEPGATQFESNDIDIYTARFELASENIYATEFDMYIEDDWEINDKLKMNGGLHASAFLVEKAFYKSLQPRISARYLINDDLSIKASFSTMTQYIHLLTNSGIGLPTDLWVPATDTVPPQRAFQPAIGMAYIFKKNYEVSVEVYYKKSSSNYLG